MYYQQEHIIERLKQLPDFKTIPTGLWIYGIRNSEPNPDKFECVFGLMDGENRVLETSGTTNPGVSILTGGFKKYNNSGAAVLESDRIYYDVWVPGKHLGKVDGLLQRGEKVTVFRDGDMDHIAEEIGDPITGWYGINFHIDQFNLREDNPSTKVGNWSAGCQVCNNLEDYKRIIELTKGQERITYVLFKEFSI